MACRVPESSDHCGRLQRKMDLRGLMKATDTGGFCSLKSEDDGQPYMFRGPMAAVDSVDRGHARG